MTRPWSNIAPVLSHCEPISASLKPSKATVAACLLAISLFPARLTAQLKITNGWLNCGSLLKGKIVRLFVIESQGVRP